MPSIVRDAILAALMICIWGSNYAIAKLGLQDIPPFLFMALRFALTAAILMPFVSLRPVGLRAVFVYAAIVGLVHFGGIFNALAVSDAATVIIVSQLNVPFSAMLAAVLLGERMTWRHIVGISTAIAGVAVFTGDPQFTGGAVGILYTLIGAAAWSVGTIWMKTRLTISPLQINFWMALFSVPLLLGASAAIGEAPLRAVQAMTWAAGGTVVYQAVFIVILGYGIWNRLVQRYDIKNVAPLTLLVPFSGLFFAWLLLGEELTAIELAGGLLTIAGVASISLSYQSIASALAALGLRRQPVATAKGEGE